MQYNKSIISIISNREKKYDKIVLLAKDKLNTIEVLTSMAMVDSSISHNEFVLVNDAARECDDMQSKIKRPEQFIENFNVFIKQC